MSSPIGLRDGSRVAIRPIEPGDRERLRSAFGRLSDRSRYLRFQAPMASLSEPQLAYLTDVDHHDHEALIGVDAERDEIVGVARFVRVEGDVAECAITVADDWQGRGLGTELLDRLVERARQEDVARFSALVLGENTEAIRLLERLGDAAKRPVGSQVELDIALPERGGPSERFRALLRGAASGAVVPGISMWRLVADHAYRRRREAIETPANAIVAHVHTDDPSAAAVRTARGLAAAGGAHLHLVESYWPLVSGREEAEGRLDRTAADLRADGVEVTAHLHSGDAVDAIIDVAEESAARLIVVDPVASTAVVPWRPHSMTDRICARAPCDVLIAR
jgi:RimJ/RimL family protein N-acetyltransferase